MVEDMDAFKQEIFKIFDQKMNEEEEWIKFWNVAVLSNLTRNYKPTVDGPIKHSVADDKRSVVHAEHPSQKFFRGSAEPANQMAAPQLQTAMSEKLLHKTLGAQSCHAAKSPAAKHPLGPSTTHKRKGSAMASNEAESTTNNFIHRDVALRERKRGDRFKEKAEMYQAQRDEYAQRLAELSDELSKVQEKLKPTK
ncbi:hypothetical protein MPSEU_000643400 [Mayamaea pseudoterrestris]|nr:hypothetical protein MPSEU_000643400 [Mayamaea pseudoterrestris]